MPVVATLRNLRRRTFDTRSLCRYCTVFKTRGLFCYIVLFLYHSRATVCLACTEHHTVRSSRRCCLAEGPRTAKLPKT